MPLSGNGVYLVCIASIACLGATTLALRKYSKHAKSVKATEEKSERSDSKNDTGWNWKSKFLNFSSFRWLAFLTKLHGKEEIDNFRTDTLPQECDEKYSESTLDEKMGQLRNAAMVTEKTHKIDHTIMVREVHSDDNTTDHTKPESTSGIFHTNIENGDAVDRLEFSSSSSEWETTSQSSSTDTTSCSCSSENTVTFELISPLEESGKGETSGHTTSDDGMSQYHAVSSLFSSTEQEMTFVEHSGIDETAIKGCEAFDGLTTLKEKLKLKENVENITVLVKDFDDPPLLKSQTIGADFDNLKTTLYKGPFETDAVNSVGKSKDAVESTEESINIPIKDEVIFHPDVVRSEKNLPEAGEAKIIVNQLALQLEKEDQASSVLGIHLSKSSQISKNDDVELLQDETVSLPQALSLPTAKKPEKQSFCNMSNIKRNIEEFTVDSNTHVAGWKLNGVEHVDIRGELTDSLTNTNLTLNEDDKVDCDVAVTNAPKGLDENLKTKCESMNIQTTLCNTAIKIDVLDEITSSREEDEKVNEASSKLNSRKEKCDNSNEIVCETFDRRRDELPANDLPSCQTSKKFDAIEKPQTSDKSVNFGTSGTTKVDVHTTDITCCDEKSQDNTAIDCCTCDCTSTFLGNTPDSISVTSPNAIVAGNTDAPNHTPTTDQINSNSKPQSETFSPERSSYDFIRNFDAEDLYCKLSKSDFFENDISNEDKMGKSWYLQIMTEEHPTAGKQDSPLNEVHSSILQTVKSICTAVTQTTFLPDLSDLSDLDYNRKAEILKPSIESCLNISSTAIKTNEISNKEKLQDDLCKQNDSGERPSTKLDLCETGTIVTESTTTETSREDAEKKRETDIAKVQKDCVVFFGTRPGPGVPTACSLDVQMKVHHTDSCNRDMNSVVEDCDSCDLKLFVKKLDGLVQEKKSKIYIKVVLENKEAGFKRKKVKTKQAKLSTSVLFNTGVFLCDIPRKVLARGTLLVAVWSSSAMESNKKLCSVDIQLGKQIRFGESNKDVVPLIDKLLEMKGSWLNSSLYLS